MTESQSRAGTSPTRPPNGYLGYLPTVLWQNDTDSAIPLGAFLRAFESLLTASDPEHPVTRGADDAHPRIALAEAIAATSDLFESWRAPSEFLPWLASLAALDFPTLAGTDQWDVYQQRNATAQIASIHRERGQRNGLQRSIDLYFAGTAHRSRITVDDGATLLTVTPRAGALPPIDALVAHGPTVNEPITFGPGKTDDPAVFMNGLIRPTCLTQGLNETIIVGDSGATDQIGELRSGIWHLDRTGKFLQSEDLPKAEQTPTGLAARNPLPLAPDTRFAGIVAVAAARGSETTYVLDKSDDTGVCTLYTLPSYSSRTATLALSTDPPAGAAALPVVEPIAMAVDGDGQILILDRGASIFGSDAARPVIVTITARPSPEAFTVDDTHQLEHVNEPLCLLVQTDDSLLIGDGQPALDVFTPDATQLNRRGNLVHIDRDNGWTVTRLLPDTSETTLDAQYHPTDNPLIAPNALAQIPDGTVFVLDAGLRPLRLPVNTLDRQIADPACIYRIAGPLTATKPGVVPQPATQRGRLVVPRGMTALGNTLIVCDSGSLDTWGDSGGPPAVLTRICKHRFAVVIHFGIARLADVPPDTQGDAESARRRLKRRTIATARAVVAENLPAHTVANVVPPETAI